MYRLTENLIIYSPNEKTFEPPGMRELLQMAAEYGFEGNLWRSYVARFIAMNENPFSLAAERKRELNKNDTICRLAAKDLSAVRKIFFMDAADVGKKLGMNCFEAAADYRGSDKKLSDAGTAIEELKATLENTSNDSEFFDSVCAFYEKYGAGVLGINNAFSIAERDGGEMQAELVPVSRLEDIRLSDLVGYEVQKQRLVQNTEAFLGGKPANNVLLFGDGGTGKSTSIRAIANEYHERGLRIIQIYRHQMKHLAEIIKQIKNRNYRFIIYMDDLSFEDFETEYKYLKAVIEGGLEPRPDNVLVYATSNRRHLIKETWGDRNDMEHEGDMHRSDSMEEKLSLAERFGVQIYYGKPTKEEFHKIVETLALRENINIDFRELRKEANKWEIRHGGVSGRSARQFVDYIKGTEENIK